MKTPVDIAFSKVTMRCAICNSDAGACDCWVRCACGWSFINPDRASKRKLSGAYAASVGVCANPVHRTPRKPRRK